ncbi:MerR family transcriptional regulator [Haliangium sp.]|uniref:MerR family transcriptional regulator n=1 Tax=Haliangium sp. TaxID=2663208 RepID=UPI003D0A6DDF
MTRRSGKDAAPARRAPDPDRRQAPERRAKAGRAGSHPYRMKDLCERTGLSRQAIHFYIQQGLLPPGKKTGRNMAYYDQAHLERLSLIRTLQRERFLPLKAIKAVLGGETAGFAPEQRRILREIKDHLSGTNLQAPERPRTVDAKAACRRHGVRVAELRRMADMGVVTLVEDDGEARIPEDDLWALEHWGRMRAIGFTDAVGFSIDDMAVYEQAVASLFERETALWLDRIGKLPAKRAADMLERALPIVHSFLARYHTAQIRNLFAAME